jgi:hypothetical protein
LKSRLTNFFHLAINVKFAAQKKALMSLKQVNHIPALLLEFFLFGLRGYWHCGHSWPIVPTSGDNEDDCGEADGM